MGQENCDQSGKEPADPPMTPAHLSGTTSEIFPQVYRQLHDLARQRMFHERSGLTIQTTALVHEVYLRLSSDPGTQWQNPRHFFAAAAEAMRRILVERARHAGRQKRGGGRKRLSLTDLDPAAEVNLADPDALLALDDALDELHTFDPDLHEVVMLRFFAGMTVEDAAAAMERSPRSIKNDWAVARAWLLRRIGMTPE